MEPPFATNRMEELSEIVSVLHVARVVSLLSTLQEQLMSLAKTWNV
jgi:hypothetical protein